MAVGSQFPMFITAEYVRDGAGFPEFERHAQESAGRAGRAIDSAFASTAGNLRRQFEGAFNDIGNLARQALSFDRNRFGSLDLNVGQLQQAATNARAHAIALREIAIAAENAARENKDLSEETRIYVQAARAAAREAEGVAQEAQQQAAAMGRLQGELNKTASATTAVVRQQGRFNDSLFHGNDGLRGQRVAMVQVGQQLQDFTVGLASGQNVATVFAQQLPQLAFAMTGFGGRVGKVAEILSGPLGFAVFGAITALGLLSPALSGAGKSSQELADRQQALATHLDNTTGKIKEQVTWLDILQGKRDLEKEQETTQKRLTSARSRLTSAFEQGFAPTAPGERGFRIALPNSVSKSGVDLLRKTYLNLSTGAIDAAKAVQIVNAAAAKDQSLKDVAKDIEKAAFAYNGAEKAAKANELALARVAVAQGAATDAQKKLVAASTESNVNVARTIELQSKLATATTDVERARIRLQQVEMRGGQIKKDDAVAQAQYRKDLDAANTALNRAEAAEKAAREAKAAHNRETRDASRLVKEQTTAEERIKRIASQFDAQPRFADQQNAAIRELDAMIEKYGKLNDAKSRAIVIDAQAAKITVNDGRDTKFDQYIEDQQRGLDIQALRNQGHAAEADALQNIYSLQERIGNLLPEQKQQVLEIARAYEAQRREAEDTRRVVEAYVGMVGEVQGAFERLAGRGPDLFKNPLKALGGFGTDLVNSFFQAQIKSASEQIFAGVDEQLRDFVTPQQKLENASIKAADAIEELAGSVRRAMAAIGGSQTGDAIASFGGVASASDLVKIDMKEWVGDVRAEAVSMYDDALRAAGINPANDNNESGDVIIDGQRTVVDELERQTAVLARGFPSVSASMNKVGEGIGDNLAGLAEGTPLEGAAEALLKVGKSLGDLVGGAAIGGTVGSVLFGGDKGALAGSSVGGALGKVAGKEIGKTFGKELKKLAPFAGPIGGIVGGLAGGLIGGMFTRTKRGSASLGYDATTGSFTSAVSGNSKSYMDAADNLGNSVTGSLQKIVEALGGELGDFSVSIGARKKKYVVDPTGSGRTKGTGLSFKEEADAIQAAIADAIRDGAIRGVRAGTNRLLQQGSDLDAAVTRAAKFEGVFDTLRQTLDPVGYAIEELDRRFRELRQIFNAAGASAEEYADLEKLYSLQRADTIKQAASAMRSSLQGLLDDLNIGDSGGLGLRDRLNNALAAYNPLAQRVAAGDKSVDYDAFTDAARTVQELARELYGSQDGFFDIVDGIRSLTEKALADQQALIDIATGAQTPFDASTPTPGAPSNDNAPVVQGLSSVEKAIASLSGLTGTKLDALIVAIRGLAPAPSGPGNIAGFTFQRQNF